MAYNNVQIRETVVLDSRGVLTKVQQVTATTKQGTVFSVDVPDASFNPQEVASRLEAKAATIYAVEAMGSDTPEAY